MRLRVERLVAGGSGLARSADGSVVFVDGALPDELVEVEVRRRKRDYADATVVRVVEPSSSRRSPPCAHRRAGCGGCDWMHIDPPAQLDAKVEIVRESLRRIGRFDRETVAAMVRHGSSVPPMGYRTTVRVVAASDGRPGFRAQRSHDVVPVGDCPVATPELSALLAGLRISGAGDVSLRVSTVDGSATVLAARGTKVAGLSARVGIGPRATLTERIEGRDLRVTSTSFFQASAAGAALLVDAVRRAAPESATAQHAVDAYGGVGLFAATALSGAARLTLVESSRSACADADHNLASRADGRRAAVRRLDVARWSPKADVDVLVADPARAGLGAGGVAALVAARAPVVVLVSCDPVAAARDVRGMVDAGYRAEYLEVLDLFPNTHHVETVTRLVRT